MSLAPNSQGLPPLAMDGRPFGTGWRRGNTDAAWRGIQLESLALGLLVFAALIVARWSIIASPPYWDFAIGLWNEANFLAETGFDYRRLWFEEKRIWEGGANCYVTSMLPTLVAAIMRATPTPSAALVVYHLLTFASAAAIAALLYLLLVPHVGRMGGLLTCGVLLTNPLFSTQIDMVGMELPMTLCAMAAVYWAVGERLVLAVIAAALAFFMKASGIVAIAALVGYLGLVLVLDSVTEPAARRRFAWGFAGALAVAVLLVVLTLWAGHVTSQLGPEHRTQAPGLGMTLFWCPELLLVFLVALAGFAVVFGRWLAKERARQRQSVRPLSWRRALATAVRAQPLVLLSGLMVFGTLITIQRVIFLPRYLLMAVPFLLLIVAIGLFSRTARRAIPAIILALWIAFNLANWDGRFYPSQEGTIETAFGADGSRFARTGGFLERSREYLADHQANIAAVQKLEEIAGETPVFVGAPFTHFLAFPRLGYVSRPLAGYTVNAFTDFVDHFAPANPNAPRDVPAEAIFLSVGNTHYNLAADFEIPPPAEDDEIIHTDHQFSPLVIYRKRWSADQATRPERIEWYVRRMWPHIHYIERAARQAEMALEMNDAELAALLLREALATAPGDPRLRRRLATALFAQGDEAGAMTEAILLVDADSLPAEAAPPESASANGLTFEEHYRQGIARLGDFEFAEALAEFQNAGELNPAHPGIRYALGLFAAARSEPQEAIRHFEAALAARPQFYEAHVQLAGVYLAQGELDAAARRYQQALQHDVDAAAAHYGLGLIRARQERFDEAAEHFAAVLRAWPWDTSAQRRLERARAGGGRDGR